jgi:hypothetical protein
VLKYMKKKELRNESLLTQLGFYDILCVK